MNTDERQEAILAELQVIRRGVRTVLCILALFVVIAMVSAANPQLGSAVTFLGGLMALVVIVGAFVGIGAAKVVSRIRQ